MMDGARLASNHSLPYTPSYNCTTLVPQEGTVRLTTFLLADHAEAVNGKLYVTGGCWNAITVSQLPARHPHFTVAAALHVPWQATNQEHSLRLELIDANGQSVLPEPLQGHFETGRPPGMRAGDEAAVVIAFNFNALELSSAGMYEFVLEVNGSEMGRASFKVIAVEPTTSTGQ
jgi:hypothetical protein